MLPLTTPRWVHGPSSTPRVAARLRAATALAAAVVRCARGSRLRLARVALLIGAPSLVSSTSGAQRVAPASDGAPRSAAAQPAIDAVEEQAAARVAAAVCDKRVVLLGELPDHGHARGFGIKARIVERLVARCGFDAVLFEAGSYEFFGFERAIAARAPTDSLDLALARAIGGFWWTRELAEWRRWLVSQAVAGRVALGGIDDQPIGATTRYTVATLPGLVAAGVPPARADECREAVARHVGWRYSATQRYDSTERARLADCTRLAADRAPGARTAGRRTPDAIMLDHLAGYFAREQGGAPDRDLVMARNIDWWAARLPRDARIVVWTATVHAARGVAAPPARAPGVPPTGGWLAGRWGDRLAVIGFTALRGQWARPRQPGQPLAPLPPDALEARALTAAAARDTAAWAYLDRAALRLLGAVPSRLFGRVATTDWSALFDGVLVIRDEGAPTSEPWR